jgi:hypothetical protein
MRKRRNRRRLHFVELVLIRRTLSEVSLAGKVGIVSVAGRLRYLLLNILLLGCTLAVISSAHRELLDTHHVHRAHYNEMECGRGYELYMIHMPTNAMICLLALRQATSIHSLSPTAQPYLPSFALQTC